MKARVPENNNYKYGYPKINHRKGIARPWFNDACEERRKTFFKYKNMFKMNPSIQNRELMQNSSKYYKVFVKTEKQKYDDKFCKKLKNLKTRNPKDYWNLLKGNSLHKPECEISIDEFKSYFENIYSLDDNSGDSHPDVFGIESDENDILNCEILETEVKRAIHNLKNSKACGSDGIINEYFKSSNHIFCPVLTKLFNTILKSGQVPSMWAEAIIKPIFKNKWDKQLPSNYRGISLLSCFGKLFTQVLNNRLNMYLESNNVIGEEQVGFRQGHSTLDHVFVLKNIIDLYIYKKKKLYCLFVDYRMAFDKINRTALWSKLLENGVNGKFLNIIRNLYMKAKSCVNVNHTLSDYFVSNVGLRQGENLSPLLFALYLNDLKIYLQSKYPGLPHLNNLSNENLSKDICKFAHFFLLMYADDTVILAESEYELQNAINHLSNYCYKWNLEVNVEKTKIMIFF